MIGQKKGLGKKDVECAIETRIAASHFFVRNGKKECKVGWFWNKQRSGSGARVGKFCPSWGRQKKGQVVYVFICGIAAMDKKEKTKSRSRIATLPSTIVSLKWILQHMYVRGGWEKWRKKFSCNFGRGAIGECK